MADIKSEQQFTFSLAGKALKLTTLGDVEEHLRRLQDMEVVKKVILSGNTFGVEAAQALAQVLKEKEDLEEVILSDMFTGRLIQEIPSAMEAFTESLLDKTHLREIDFSDNAFGPAGAASFTRLLVENRNIEVLKLNNNGLGNEGGRLIAKALLTACSKNKSENRENRLRIFSAGRNRLENVGAKALASAFEAMGGLHHIALYQNGIRSEGIKVLCRALSRNPQLEYLDFTDNTLVENGTKALSRAIPFWTSLRVLKIGDCLTKSKGIHHLATAIQGNQETPKHHVSGTTYDFLDTVDVSFNELHDHAAIALVKALIISAPSLKHLDLNGNALSIHAIETIKSLLDSDEIIGSLSENDESEVEEEEEEEEEKEFSEEEEDYLEEAREEIEVALETKSDTLSYIDQIVSEPSEGNLLAEKTTVNDLIRMLDRSLHLPNASN